VSSSSAEDQDDKSYKEKESFNNSWPRATGALYAQCISYPSSICSYIPTIKYQTIPWEKWNQKTTKIGPNSSNVLGCPGGKFDSSGKYSHSFIIAILLFLSDMNVHTLKLAWGVNRSVSQQQVTQARQHPIHLN
jgi:hypothetical protein